MYIRGKPVMCCVLSQPCWTACSTLRHSAGAVDLLSENLTGMLPCPHQQCFWSKGSGAVSMNVVCMAASG